MARRRIDDRRVMHGRMPPVVVKKMGAKPVAKEIVPKTQNPKEETWAK